MAGPAGQSQPRAMSEAETRTLSRAAAVLLLAGAARWAYEARRAEPLFPPDSTGVLPSLLEASREERETDLRRRTPLAEGEMLDPNRAPAEELDRLPGVGPSVAGAIVAEREEGGPFRTPEELQRVRGIGPATLERIRPLLDLSRVPPARAVERLARDASPREGGGGRRSDGAPALVDVNRATARELEALPGIGPALAGRIVASREEEGPFRTVEDLQRVRGIGPATVERLRPLARAGPG